MTTFGTKLRQQREARGVSLGEIAEATKIGTRYLDALEKNEFDSLPGDVFARGYVRAYAEFVGFDPEPLVDEYSRARTVHGENARDDEQAMLRELSRRVDARLADSPGPGPGPRRGLVIAVAVVGLASVVGIATWHWPTGAPSESEIVAVEPAAQTTDEAVEPPPVRPPPEPAPAVAETVVAPPASVAPTERPPVAQVPPAAETTTSRPRSEPPPPRPAKPTVARPASQLEVQESGVGTDVVRRRLVGRGDRFVEGTTVWFWTRVVGGRSGDRLQHVWLRDGRAVETISLKLGGSHWRTQSRKSLREGNAGRWAVEARDEQGRVLARQEFEVVGAGDAVR